MSVKDLAKKTKEASMKALAYSEEQRQKALLAIADKLLEKKELILCENAKDIELAKEQKLQASLLDRLLLTEERIISMAQGAKQIAQQEKVVGKVLSKSTREDGLIIQKERIPLGVIAMIFESRPNVVIDCSCLAIKSGNGIILKGGKEAKHSNKVLASLVKEAIAPYIDENLIALIDSKDEVQTLITLNEYVDVVIPRGGERLINYVYEKATIPVIAHFKGLCHIYIHSDANLERASEIIMNAKVQRPGVCNAMESLILHKDLDQSFIKKTLEKLVEEGVELFISPDLIKMIPSARAATEKHYATEYLDLKLSVSTVNDENEAISHIQKYGSKHTEAILSEDSNIIDKFKASIDASCIMVNASTRFNDGGELGLGAELGISTTKFHAYGPMGAEEMTTSRFVVIGSGHIRM